jgi:hypothetical protein
MKHRLIFFILVLAGGVGPGAWGAALTNDFQVRSQASNSLAVYQALITPANYNLLGFHSTNDILQATNGEPLVAYEIGLNQLRTYLLGGDFEPLLEPNPNLPSQRVIVPVMVGTNVRSSITLREQVGQGHWTNANWGQPKLIRELNATYCAIPNAQLFPRSVRFVVEIPVFDFWLVGYYDTQNRLVLRSTRELHLGQLVINPHQVITQAVMYRLAIAAQHYNGLPN